MLWRDELRTTALTLITQALRDNGASVVANQDIPSQVDEVDDLYRVIVYADDQKRFLSIAPVTARTHGLVTIEVLASGKTANDAATALSTLCELIENTILSSPIFIRLVEGLDSYDTFAEYKGVETERHLAGATIEIKCHTSEVFEPPRGPDMTGINVYVDSVNIFDPNSDYAGAEPFNVNNPPPRTAGPDGRPEIAAIIDLPADIPKITP